MSETFTTDELVAALLDARYGPGDDPTAVSLQELVNVTGKSAVLIARRLRRLMEAGQVEAVRKPWTRIDGIRTTIPAYRLKGGNDADGGD